MMQLPALTTCSGPTAHVASTGVNSLVSFNSGLVTKSNDSMLVRSGGAKRGVHGVRIVDVKHGAATRTADPSVATGVSNWSPARAAEVASRRPQTMWMQRLKWRMAEALPAPQL